MQFFLYILVQVSPIFGGLGDPYSISKGKSYLSPNEWQGKWNPLDQSKDDWKRFIA